MEGTTAKGIQVSNWKNAQDTQNIYGDEIILSGGAINSPSLLQLRRVFIQKKASLVDYYCRLTKIDVVDVSVV